MRWSWFKIFCELRISLLINFISVSLKIITTDKWMSNAQDFRHWENEKTHEGNESKLSRLRWFWQFSIQPIYLGRISYMNLLFLARAINPSQSRSSQQSCAKFTKLFVHGELEIRDRRMEVNKGKNWWSGEVVRRNLREKTQCRNRK